MRVAICSFIASCAFSFSWRSLICSFSFPSLFYLFWSVRECCSSSSDSYFSNSVLVCCNASSFSLSFSSVMSSSCFFYCFKVFSSSIYLSSTSDLSLLFSDLSTFAYYSRDLTVLVIFWLLIWRRSISLFRLLIWLSWSAFLAKSLSLNCWVRSRLNSSTSSFSLRISPEICCSQIPRSLAHSCLKVSSSTASWLN